MIIFFTIESNLLDNIRITSQTLYSLFDILGNKMTNIKLNYCSGIDNDGINFIFKYF
jgi:hypothetical protein